MKNLSSKEAFEKAGIKPGAILIQNVCPYPRPYIFKELRDKSFIVQSVVCDVERLEIYGTEWYYIGESVKEEEKPKPVQEGLYFGTAYWWLLRHDKPIRRRVWGGLCIRKDDDGDIVFYNDVEIDYDWDMLNAEDLNTKDWEVLSE